MPDSKLPLDPLIALIDDVVAAWPDVRPKNVFGHRGYVRAGRMFAFVAETGVAVKASSPAEADELYAMDGVVPFVYGEGMEMRGWPVLPVRSEAQADEVLTLVRRAYEGTLTVSAR